MELNRMVLMLVGRLHTGTLTTCGLDKGPHVTEASGASRESWIGCKQR